MYVVLNRLLILINFNFIFFRIIFYIFAYHVLLIHLHTIFLQFFYERTKIYLQFIWTFVAFQ